MAAEPRRPVIQFARTVSDAMERVLVEAGAFRAPVDFAPNSAWSWG